MTRSQAKIQFKLAIDDALVGFDEGQFTSVEFAQVCQRETHRYIKRLWAINEVNNDRT